MTYHRETKNITKKKKQQSYDFSITSNTNRKYKTKKNQRCTDTDHFLQSNQEFTRVLTAQPPKSAHPLPIRAKELTIESRFPQTPRNQYHKRKNATTDAREKNFLSNRESATRRKRMLSEGGK